MRYLAIVFVLLASFASGQAFPPDGTGGLTMGGAASAPITGVDGCVTPAFAFTNDPDSGFCRDDGTGPYALESIAIQTSDPTDLEYAGLQCSEVGGDPFFCIAAAFDDGANNGASIFWQAIGTTTPIAQIVMLASDFTGGVTGSTGFNLVAPDAGTPVATLTVTGNAGPVSTTTFGDTSTTFSDQILGFEGSLSLPGYGFTVQPDAGLWITGAAGSVLIQNKDATPDLLGRARLTIGEEAWSLSAVHDTVDTRQAFAQGSSEASAQMRLRQGATDDTSNETELFMDPDAINMRVETGGVNTARFDLDEAGTAITTLGAAVTTQAAPPAAGASGDLTDLVVTVNAMDGADIVNVWNTTITNAVHTGVTNELRAFNVEALAAGSTAEETAYYVQNTGNFWDFAFRQGGGVTMNIASDDAITMVAEGGAIQITSDTAGVQMFGASTGGGAAVTIAQSGTISGSSVSSTGADSITGTTGNFLVNAAVTLPLVLNGDDTVTLFNAIPNSAASTGTNNFYRGIAAADTAVVANIVQTAFHVGTNYDNFLQVREAGDTASFQLPALTADRDYTFQDATGTYPLFQPGTSTLVDAVASNTILFSIVDQTFISGTVIYDTVCVDATEQIRVRESLDFVCFNDADTETCDFQTGAPASLATGGATMVPSYDITTGTNTITFRVTADCSLTPTTLEAYWEIQFSTPDWVAVTEQN